MKILFKILNKINLEKKKKKIEEVHAQFKLKVARFELEKKEKELSVGKPITHILS